jgi:hypothetical protein
VETTPSLKTSDHFEWASTCNRKPHPVHEGSSEIKMETSGPETPTDGEERVVDCSGANDKLHSSLSIPR